MGYRSPYQPRSGRLPAWLRRFVLERHGYRCVRCKRPGFLELDHIVPMYRGGAMHDPTNLQVLCRSCHISKSASESRDPRRPLPDYLRQRSRLPARLRREARGEAEWKAYTGY